MAELPREEADRMMHVFARAYNSLRGADFAFDRGATDANAKARGSNQDRSVDYICSSASSTRRLLVQHTEAWSHVHRERFWKRHVGVIRAGVESQLASLPGGPYRVTLSIAEAPRSPESARRVVDALRTDLQQHVTGLAAGKKVRWNPASNVRAIVPTVGLWWPEPALGKSIVIAAQAKSRLDPVGVRAQLHLKLKTKHYRGTETDLVLLIHYRVTSYEREDLPDITASVSQVQHGFREVWVYTDWWIDEPLAHCAWDRRSLSSPT